MKAAVVTRFGAPVAFEISEMPDPIPGRVNLHTDSLPLEYATEAHRRIEARRVNERILLVP